MNTCNGIDGGFTPTDGWLLMRERRTAAKGPLCSGCCAIRRGPCRYPACSPYDTFWTRPSGTYQR